MASENGNNPSATSTSELTNSSKTELINTTLKNVHYRRCRAPAQRTGVGGTNSLSDFEDLGDFVAFWLTAFQNLFLIPRNKFDETCEIFESGDDICYIVEKGTDENSQNGEKYEEMARWLPNVNDAVV